jgi:hypothetical protein
MSEFTRAQILRLLEHAADVLRRSQESRAKLEAALKRIEEAGSTTEPAESHAEAERNAAK